LYDSLLLTGGLSGAYRSLPVLIETEPGADWRDLQTRLATILQECGFVIGVARDVSTARGRVEVDVYATDLTTNPPAIYLCECKRWASNVPQGEVQTFRTVVADSGAHFGLFISARGFQSGAYEVVRNTNVHLLSWAQFQELFLERWCKRHWVPTFRNEADPLLRYVDPPSGSDAAGRAARGEPLEPAEAVGLLALNMWGEPFVTFPSVTESEPLAKAIERHMKAYSALSKN
jgi:hypothetical protein